MGRLNGRVAIVTGGAHGIGRHYSEALAREGAQVVLADIADPQPAAQSLCDAHGADAALGLAVDVSDEAAVRGLMDKVIGQYARIDVLVNNAAYLASLPMTPATEWSVEMWDRVMAVNVRGPFLMVKHVAPRMMAQRSGKIINIGSTSTARGGTDMLPYITSKGATTAFTRALSREFGDHGICVNTLAPGFILSDTLMHNTQHVEAVRDRATQNRAFKRDAYPQDLVGALLFLASSDSDFVTGQTLVVDGGSVNT